MTSLTARLEENEAFTGKLRVALTAKYGEERDGVHVTDLVLCPREVLFRKFDPKPITDLELMFYVMGEGHHGVIQGLVEQGVNIIEKEIELQGVKGTVDILEAEDVPIEIKTMRTRKDEAKSHHLKQLSYYMAMMGKNVGLLLYVMLMNFDGRQFVTRTLTLNDLELASLRNEISVKAMNFNVALAARDPFQAQHVKNTELSWKCEHCKYKAPCHAKEEA